ncbi:MAG: PQQ-binding-like beta-propeller repeat protein [Candidatus Methanofastidiosia archaeon]
MKWRICPLLICLICSCVTQNGDDWPMFQHDPQHIGFSGSSMPFPLREAWVHKGMGRYGVFVVSDERLFIPCESVMSCIDIKDGSVWWNTDLGRKVLLWSIPAATSKRVFVGGMGAVFCFDADTGELAWKKEEEYVDFYSPPIVIGQLVIIGSGKPLKLEATESAKKVMCLDAETGEVIWDFYASDLTAFSPSYYESRIFVNAGRFFYCLDVQTGDVIWEREIEQMSFSGLSLDEERILVGISDGIACLDMEAGDLLWHFKCGEMVFRCPATAYDKVFFGTPDGIFYCLDAKKGELFWRTEIGSVISTEAVIADEKVAFGTVDGTLYIMDTESGEVCESIDLGENQITSLALTNGKLIAGLWDGTVICFEGSPFWKTTPVAIGSAAIISFLIFFWYYRRRSLRSGQ